MGWDEQPTAVCGVNWDRVICVHDFTYGYRGGHTAASDRDSNAGTRRHVGCADCRVGTHLETTVQDHVLTCTAQCQTTRRESVLLPCRMPCMCGVPSENTRRQQSRLKKRRNAITPQSGREAGEPDKRKPETFQASRKTAQSKAHQSRRESPQNTRRNFPSRPSSPPRVLCLFLRSSSPCPLPVHTLRPGPNPAPSADQIRRPRPWRRAGECSSRSSSSATAGTARSLPLSIPPPQFFLSACSFAALLIACAGC